MRINTTTTCALLLAAAIPWWLIPLIRYWGIQTEYTDRWLVLLVAAAIAWQRYAHRPPIRKLPPPRFLAAGLLLGGGLLLPLGVFLQVQVTPRPLLLWWLFIAWLALVAGTLLHLGGLPLLRHFAFPLAFLLFALPFPNRLQLPLQFSLQYSTTALAGLVLDALGWTVQRHGFVLRLPHCDLNVVEACSGVRSMTAMLAVATFLAYLHHLSLRRGLVLLALALPLIALINAGRVIASGILCESWGPASIQGWRHQALGLFMVIIGFGLLYGLARQLQPRSRYAVSSPTTTPTPPSPPSQAPMDDADLTSRPNAACSPPIPTAEKFSSKIGMVLVSLGISTFATLLALWLGWQQQAEVQAEAPLEQFPLRFADFAGQDMPIPDSIREMLTPDQILHRTYCDSLGHTWEVWIIFWSSPAMVKGYHHPDICWPNHGFECLDRRFVPLSLHAGQLTVTERLFAKDSQRYMIWYWTQEGRQVWSEADERRVQLLGDSHEWVMERLWYQRLPQVRGRLTVWVGTSLWGQRSFLEATSYPFLRQLAEHLYQLCPWAYPASP